jgi:hypothetical protein
MKEYIIVEQTDDDVSVITSSDLPEGRKSAAIEKAFPTGSDWANFANARSFRFAWLTHEFYLLSYTFVLGHQQNLWDGTLRAWGLIGKRDTFIEGEGLNKYDPHQLFQRHQQLFTDDPYYQVMLEGLIPPLTSRERVKIPFGLKFLNWAGFRIPQTFSVPFTDRSNWASVESALYKQWHGAMTSPIGKHFSTVTFTTFTLSKNERTKMNGIPKGV